MHTSSVSGSGCSTYAHENIINKKKNVIFDVRQTMSLNWSSAISSDCANENTHSRYAKEINALQLHWLKCFAQKSIWLKWPRQSRCKRVKASRMNEWMKFLMNFPDTQSMNWAKYFNQGHLDVLEKHACNMVPFQSNAAPVSWYRIFEKLKKITRTISTIKWIIYSIK